ncbi:hypothetical protein Tco_0088800 [Tanacetum coccineum]
MNVTHPHLKRNFIPIAVATKSGQVPVNAAKQSSPIAATSISIAKPVNTVSPKLKVNDALPTTYSYFKAHSPPKAVVSATVGNRKNVVKSSACWIWRPTKIVIDHNSKDSGSYMFKRFDYADLQGIFDSGCSRHMNGNKSFLIDYQEIDGGFVAFAGSAKEELKFNLFSVSQICDKKNNVLFTDTECVVLSPDFKLLDESQVLLKVPRNNNMYSFDLKNVVPLGGYSISSKAFRVFNARTRFVEENLHINFLENKPNVAGTEPNWMFDIDTLTMSMNYQPVFAGNQTNGNTGTKANIDEGQGGMKTVPEYDVADDAGKKNGVLDLAKEDDKSGQGEATNTNNTNRLNTVGSSINTVSSSFTNMDPGREKSQRNEFESVFGQDKDANGNSIYRMFTPVNVAGSSCDNLGGSIPVNAATLPNTDLPTDPSHA